MGLLGRLLGIEKREVTPLSVPVWDGAGMAQLWGRSGLEDAAGQAVAERCRSLISQTTASVPLILYRRLPDGGREEAREHRVYALLNDEASEGVTAFELRESLARDAASYGNALCQVVRDGRGQPEQLVYHPWPGVGLERLQNGRLRYRLRDSVGHELVLLASEVVHLKYASRDGVIGVDPLTWAKTSSALVAEQAELARSQTRTGFRPHLVFETESTFGPDKTGNWEMANAAFVRLREQLAEAVRRMGQDAKPLLLEGGLTAKPVTQSQRDSQFAEARLVGLEDIARAFSIPLSLVGLGKQTSYGSLSEESKALQRDCIGPWARRIESALALALLSPQGRRTFLLEHDLSGLQRGDMASRFDAWSKGVQGGWLAPNEPRRWENLNSLPGGDVPLRPLNVAPATPN